MMNFKTEEMNSTTTSGRQIGGTMGVEYEDNYKPKLTSVQQPNYSDCKLTLVYSLV